MTEIAPLTSRHTNAARAGDKPAKPNDGGARPGVKPNGHKAWHICASGIWCLHATGRTADPFLARRAQAGHID